METRRKRDGRQTASGAASASRLRSYEVIFVFDEIILHIISGRNQTCCRVAALNGNVVSERRRLRDQTRQQEKIKDVFVTSLILKLNDFTVNFLFLIKSTQINCENIIT